MKQAINQYRPEPQVDTDHIEVTVADLVAGWIISFVLGVLFAVFVIKAIAG